MGTNLDTEREAVRSALQAHGAYRDVEGALLTNYVIVAEWMMPDGQRRLTRTDSEAVTGWLRTGMLQWALDDDWEPSEIDGEDER